MVERKREIKRRRHRREKRLKKRAHQAIEDSAGKKAAGKR